MMNEKLKPQKLTLQIPFWHPVNTIASTKYIFTYKKINGIICKAVG